MEEISNSVNSSMQMSRPASLVYHPLRGNSNYVAPDDIDLEIAPDGIQNQDGVQEPEQNPVQLEQVLTADFKNQLEDMLKRAALNSSGDVSFQDLQNAIADAGFMLTPAQTARLQELERNVADSMQPLANLTGEELFRAFKSKNQTVLAMIDRATEAQHALSDAIRSMRFQQLDAGTLNSAEAIDTFKANNITTVKDIMHDVLEKTTALPFTHETLTDAITGFPANAQNSVMQKAEAIKAALKRLNQETRGIGIKNSTVTDGAVATVKYAIDSLVQELRNLKQNGRREAWIAHYNHGIDTLLPQLQQFKDNIAARCDTLNGYSETLFGIRQQTQPLIQTLRNAHAQLPSMEEMTQLLQGKGVSHVLPERTQNAVLTQLQKTNEALHALAQAADTAVIATGISKNGVRQAAEAVRKLAEELRKANAGAQQPLDDREDRARNLDRLAADIENSADALNALAEKSIDIESNQLRHLRNEHYSMQLEVLADRCDQRASEITNVIVSIMDFPAIDEIKETASRLPFNAATLEQAIRDFPRNEQNDIRQKMTKAQNALNQFIEDLDKAKDRKGGHIKEKNLNKAFEALFALADALRNLRLADRARYSAQLEAMADGLDSLTSRLNSAFLAREECLSSTIFTQANNARAQMHGTTEAILHYMGEPMRNLQDFVQNPGKKWTVDKILEVQADFTSLQKAISDISENASLTLEDGTTVLLDQQLLQQLEQPLLQPLRAMLDTATAELRKSAEMLRHDAWARQVDKLTELAFPTFEMSPELLQLDFIREGFPIMTQLAELSMQYRSLQNEILTDSQAALEKLKTLNHSLKEKLNSISTEAYAKERGFFKQLQIHCNEYHSARDIHAIDSPQLEGLNIARKALARMSDSDFQKVKAAIVKDIIQSHPLNFDAHFVTTNSDDMIWLLKHKNTPFMEYAVSQVETLYAKIASAVTAKPLYLKGAHLRNALTRNIPLSTIIESQVYGASPDMIDELCDDTNLVRAEPLENTPHIYQCTYRKPDGELAEKVFKKELSSYTHNFSLLLGEEGITSSQVASMNIATVKCAAFLNAADIFPNVSVGMLKGTYGTFMDKAMGTSPNTMFTKYLQRPMPQRANERFGAAWNRKVRGRQMRQCNKLQWMDILMGQCDRHAQNYMLNVKEDDDVELKAIDNDFCLLENKPGIYKVKVSDKQLERALPRLFDNNRDNLHAFLAALMGKDALEETPNGELVFNTQNMTPMELSKLMKITGIQSFSIPEFMDNDIYSALMELKANPEKRLQMMMSLPADLSDTAKTQFMHRLNEMFDKAEAYKAQGLVLTADEWEDENRQLQMEQALEAKNLLLKKDHAENENDSQFWEQQLCTDLYFRDLGFKTALAVNPAEANQPAEDAQRIADNHVVVPGLEEEIPRI